MAFSLAISSRSRSANDDPFNIEELIAWAREAIEPAVPRPAPEHQPLGGPAPHAVPVEAA